MKCVISSSSRRSLRRRKNIRGGPVCRAKNRYFDQVKSWQGDPLNKVSLPTGHPITRGMSRKEQHVTLHEARFRVRFGPAAGLGYGPNGVAGRPPDTDLSGRLAGAAY